MAIISPKQVPPPDPVKLAAILKTMKPTDAAPAVSPADYPGSYLWNRGSLSPPQIHAAKIAVKPSKPVMLGAHIHKPKGKI